MVDKGLKKRKLTLEKTRIKIFCECYTSQLNDYLHTMFQNILDDGHKPVTGHLSLTLIENIIVEYFDLIDRHD